MPTRLLDTLIPTNGTNRTNTVQYSVNPVWPEDFIVALSDMTLVCNDCGAEFPFTVGEQEFFASRGFTNYPKRCASCRNIRRNQQPRNGGGGGGGGGYGAPRETFPITCGNCGIDATVPFRPRGDRPVYCNDCFSQMRNR